VGAGFGRRPFAWSAMWKEAANRYATETLTPVSNNTVLLGIVLAAVSGFNCLKVESKLCRKLIGVKCLRPSYVVAPSPQLA
jgi:hypothetical protein